MDRLGQSILIIAVAGLAGCAAPTPKQVAIRAVDANGPVADARCVARSGSGVWEVATPGAAPVGRPLGPQTLRVRCSKAGYADSEWAAPSQPRWDQAPWADPWGPGCAGAVWRSGFCSWRPAPWSGGERWEYPEAVTVEMTPLR